MRVRLTSQMSGTRNGLEWPPAGSVVDLPDDEARALLTGGSAVEESADQPKVMVPPAGVHTPGAVAYQEPGVTHLVEAPADAASDPEGVRQAIRDRDEGNVVEVPAGTGLQERSGAALTKDAVGKSVEAEDAAREALKAGTLPAVGEKPASAKPAKATQAKADGK